MHELVYVSICGKIGASPNKESTMFEVKLPLGTSLHVETVVFPGLLRPKHFIVLKLKHPQFTLERYARSWPVLLRYRLWKKTKKLCLAHHKLRKFIDNQGARVD